MNKTEVDNVIINHPLYIALKMDIINRPAGAIFKPRYNKDCKLSCYCMGLLLQDLKDSGYIDTYLHHTFLRLDK